MIVESRRSDNPVAGQRSGPPPASCVCGHRGRFRLDRTRSSSGGWQSMSTILCYAAIRERGQRRSIGHFFAVSAVVLAGLVATTLVAGALEYLGSPLDPA